MKNKYWIAVLVLIITGTVFQGLTMFRSGAMYNYGIGFWGPTARDGVWHQALVGQLIKSIPPENPGFSGSILTNYHYYYDLLVAITSKLTGISISNLIYRIFPIIFSILFGLGTYYLSDLLFKNKITNLLALFFAYFGSSFGWIVEYFRVGRFGGESAFWMSQPVSMNLNPPFAVSMVLVIGILILILKRRNHSNWKTSLLLIFLIAILSAFKIYAGILILISLGIVSFYELLIFKKSDLILVFIPSLFFALVIFFSQNKGTSNFIVLKPFWLVNSMIDSPDRVGWLKLSQAREAYYMTGNWIRYLLAQILSLGIYLVGNFGTRIIGLGFLIMNIKSIFKERKIYLLTVILKMSLIIPLFIIQKGNPWNTIQFSYYALYILALYTAGYVRVIISNIKRNKSLWFALIALLLIITPISSYTTFTFAFTDEPPAKLSKDEYAALEILKDAREGVVLTPIFNKDLRPLFSNPFPIVTYDSTSYVSAYSGKVVYLEDEEQQNILGEDYLLRVSNVKRFFIGDDVLWAREFLRKNNIKYIYLPKVYNYSLNNYLTFVRLVLENKEALVYEIVN